MESNEELRFGVMCSGLEFSDYVVRAIEQLRDVGGVSLEVLIIDDSADTEGEETDGILSRQLETLASLTENKSGREAVNYVSWWLNRQLSGVPDCDQKVDLSDQLADVDRLYCNPKQDGYSVYIREEDLDRIRELELDFLLRRGFGIVRGKVLDIPSYGVWSFHHADERKYRGGPPGFWEIHSGDPVTGAILQRVTDRLDSGTILRRGFFPTLQSYTENVNQIKYGSAKWPAQVARDIRNGNDDYITDDPSSTDAKIYKLPSPQQLLSTRVRKPMSTLNTLTSGIEDWNMGVIEAPIEELGEKDHDITWFNRSEPTDSYIADPFGCEIDDQRYVFFEEFLREPWKGQISYVEYDDGFGSEKQVALEEPFHLSYPSLYRYGESIYATPVTNEASEIRLYRVDRPEEWVHETTLVSDIKASDPTVVQYDDQWWMFYTRHSEYKSHVTELEIQHAPHPEGPWTEHENNPVKTDVRSARPGGTPYLDDGKLFRPAQYCAGEYGKKIVVNEITELTRTTFSERNAYEIEPRPGEQYPVGRHTLSAFGDLTLVDGKQNVWNRHTPRWRSVQIQDKLGL